MNPEARKKIEARWRRTGKLVQRDAHVYVTVRRTALEKAVGRLARCQERAAELRTAHAADVSDVVADLRALLDRTAMSLGELTGEDAEPPTNSATADAVQDH